MRWAIAVTLLTAGAAACGGGHAAPTPDAGRPDASADARPPDAIQVAITAPADGAVIGGARTITVAGTIAAAAQVTSVTVTVGTVAFTPTFDDTSFTATVTLADHANTIGVVAIDAIGGTGTAHASVTYPFVHVIDFDSANVVIGQPDGTTGTQRATDGTTLDNPVGDPALAGATFYVAALGENRVLGFAALPGTDEPTADFVLGQATPTGKTGATGATGMAQPSSVASDGAALVESDHANNRVLLWHAAPTAMDAPADVAIGQADTGGNTGACARTGLDGPIGVVIAGGRLIVADTNNNRVMIWNALPSASGAPADLVLGQGDFTHCAANDDNQDGATDATPSRRTLTAPIGVASDGTHLWVADSSNNRVLVWNTFPTSSFAPADAVLGQTDFTSGTGGLGPTSFAVPQMMTTNGTQLALTDTNNDRVLVWDSLPTADTPPDHVLGQSDLAHGAPNDDDQDGTKDATPSARTLSAPRGVLFTSDSLVVVDASNNRTLIFP